MRLREALELARWYASQDVRTLPAGVIQDEARGVTLKRPLTEHGHLDATADDADLLWLFEGGNDRLRDAEELVVGACFGPTGYVVIDYDTKQGKEGGATLKRHLETWPDIAICRYRSISGALNVIVRKPEGLGMVGNVVPADWLGTDVRGDHGWVVAPGSQCSWGEWRWEPGSEPLSEAWVMPPAFASLLASAKPHVRPAGTEAVARYIEARSAYTPATEALVASSVADLASVGDGPRHTALLTCLGRIIGLNALDLDNAMQRVQEVWERLTAGEAREREPMECLQWVIAQELERPPQPTALVGTLEVVPSEARYTDDVWEARAWLSHLRRAAWSRNRSPEALLAAVLARLAADSPHTIDLPAIVGAPCGLTLYAALVGPPGTGKSSTRHLARELVPALILTPVTDDKSLGSGEGLIEVLFDFEMQEDERGKSKQVKVQKRFNAYLGADEGETLDRLGKRADSTLHPTLRSAFTSAPLGQTNASIEKRRNVESGLYVFGLVMGAQPTALRDLFKGIGVGTPQRFLFAPTTTNGTMPEARSDWPGPMPRMPLNRMTLDDYAQRNALGFVRHVMELPASVADEIWQMDRHAQAHGTAAFDEHRGLMRLKIAGVLAVADGRLAMSEEDWQLAGAVVEVGAKARAEVLEVHAREDMAEAQGRTRAAVSRAITIEERTEAHQAETIALWIKGKVTERGPMPRKELRNGLAPKKREHFESGLDWAIREGWVEEINEPSHTGSVKRTIKAR